MGSSKFSILSYPYSIIKNCYLFKTRKKGKLRGAYMIWNYRGAGILFAKKDKENNFVVCLGKRKWNPFQGYYSILGGESNGNSFHLIGFLKFKSYYENFMRTALREAREECKIVGVDFPGLDQLVSLSKISLGIYNWETFGHFIENPDANILSISSEFDELNWYRINELPSPMFIDLRHSIFKFEKLMGKY